MFSRDYRDSDIYKASLVVGIGSTAKHVLQTMISRFQNQNTGLCCPSYESIAEATELSRTAVRTALRKLKEHGILIVDRTGRYNKYTFNFSGQPIVEGELADGEIADDVTIGASDALLKGVSRPSQSDNWGVSRPSRPDKWGVSRPSERRLTAPNVLSFSSSPEEEMMIQDDESGIGYPVSSTVSNETEDKNKDSNKNKDKNKDTGVNPRPPPNKKIKFPVSKTEQSTT